VLLNRSQVVTLCSTSLQNIGYQTLTHLVNTLTPPGAVPDAARPPYASWMGVLMDTGCDIIDGTPIAFNGSGGGGALGLGVGVPFYIITPP
jgi:hypothetical protein